MIKSPLRYPGGKSRAVKIISKYIPKDTTHLCSPFFGGGSLEIYCAQNGIRVYGYDIFGPLVDFWQVLLRNPQKLAASVKKYHPLKKEKFYELQKLQIQSKSKLERASIFFVLNRTSFSGSTLSGGMASGGIDNNPRFTKSSIEKLRIFRIKNLTVQRLDFKKSILRHKKALLYLDPPYLIQSKLYGKKGDLHKNFDHAGLAEILKKRNNWILSYNNSREIHEIYSDYTILYPDWKYGMSNNKKSREILILSHDLE
ncbi:DNA adenine methylase [Candidatus Nitrosotenuis aquarius]|uniref:DNA adenine methylase n=1 Tax=Candidatus Nitrosotenuis aquarius TaxID=1846278 RepID=UPI000C1E0365|nr:DNA adenine methylase [Candidatus Nitrosotenuis aquarius]